MHDVFGLAYHKTSTFSCTLSCKNAYITTTSHECFGEGQRVQIRKSCRGALCNSLSSNIWGCLYTWQTSLRGEFPGLCRSHSLRYRCSDLIWYRPKERPQSNLILLILLAGILGAGIAP